MQSAGAVLIVAAGVAGLLGTARAQVGSEQPASIVVFPKIVVDGTRDTIVQLSNTANATTYAHCWYRNGALANPALPPGPANPPLWTSADFTVVLTKQQPTTWVVSRGRMADVPVERCTRDPSNYDCYGAGFDPGRVPVMAEGFTGELRCIETDAIGAPLSGNHLTGEATLEDRVTGDVAKYSAIGFAGLEGNDGDDVLRLGEEYAGCPQSLVFDHAAEGAAAVGLDADSSVATELTIIPCSVDYTVQVPETVIVQFLASNEFEQVFSASVVVTCWRSASLHELDTVFGLDALGTPTAQTLLRASAASSSGILAVVEEQQRIGDLAARAAINVHSLGVRDAGDLITVP